MTASCAPTATVSSSSTEMPRRIPDAGDGISVSTLSVDTSSSGSSTSTRSPSFFSQRVTVPSVTLSPSCGMDTETDMVLATPRGGFWGKSRKLRVYVQRLAGQREMRLADRLRLGGVGVDELGHVRWPGVPVVDQMRSEEW